MRSAVLVEFLGEGAIHLFCSGNAVIFDCYMPEDDATYRLSAEAAARLESSSLKFDSIHSAYFLSSASSDYWRQRLKPEKIIDSSSDSDQFTNGKILVRRIQSGSDRCMYSVSADGTGILITGNESPDTILSFLSEQAVLYKYLFISDAVLLSSSLPFISEKSGAEHIYAYFRSPDDGDDNELSAKMDRRIEKLRRKNINARVIQSYPTGIII